MRFLERALVRSDSGESDPTGSGVAEGCEPAHLAGRATGRHGRQARKWTRHRIYDEARGGMSQLTSDMGAHSPVWTPDGRAIVHAAEGASGPEVWLSPINGQGVARRLSGIPASLSRHDHEGRRACSPPTTTRCGRISGSFRSPELGARGPGSAANAQWDPVLSPDGRWLAYASIESGGTRSMCGPLPETGDRGGSPSMAASHLPGHPMGDSSTTSSAPGCSRWISPPPLRSWRARDACSSMLRICGTSGTPGTTMSQRMGGTL